VKGDPRINRKGRPRKEKPLDTAQGELKTTHGVHEKVNEFDRRDNKYFQARVHLDCYFHGIFDIIRLLAEHKIIKKHEDESLEWTLNRDSLAQLFKKWPYVDSWIPGGFWGPVETAFKIKRYSLRYLVSTNGRYYDRVNPDYEKIKKIIQDEYEINL
jgi:hypothetical protein